MIVGTHANPDRPRGDHGLVPLINVVFLLLAFFMIAGQIQRSNVVRVHPPVSISETVPAEQRTELVVDREGTVYLDGAAVALEALASALESRVGNPASDIGPLLPPPDRLGSAPRAVGPNDPARRVILVKADADLDVAKLEGVLAELVRAGASRAALATTMNQP